MLRHIFLITILFIYELASAQSCSYKNLSRAFDFKIHLKKTGHKGTSDSINSITISIQNKVARKPVQTIKYDAGFLFSDAFTNSNFARSYSTRKNRKNEVVDYDFGDLVIADFNFDGKDDFAVKNDSGGNGGPYYNFYVQGKNGLFSLDKYLTDSVGSFPKYINKANKTITTQIHASATEECKTTYQFNIAKNSWAKIKRIWVKY